MRKPLFTIVIPAYNHENYVTEAIQSVLKQTYQNIELIVIDDGSTDRTPERIAKINRKKPRLFTFIRQANKGIGKTLNRGLRLSHGKYFYYLASDDLLPPKTLELIVEQFEKLPPETGFIHTQVWHQPQEIKPIPKQLPEPISEGLLWKKLLLNQAESVLGPACFFKTAALKKVKGFHEELPLEDFFVLLKLSYNYPSFYLKQKMVLHRHHQTNNAINYHKIGPAAIRSIELFFKTYKIKDSKLKREALALRYLWQFWVGFDSHDRNWSLKYIGKYMPSKPFSIFTDLNLLKALVRTILNVYR
jgi:alpha-1,3-rhamnosyltransferase